MAELTINRRQLLKLGISSGVLAAMPFRNVVLADEVSDTLLEFVSGSDLPVNETEVGRMSRPDFNTLSTLCAYVDRVWELTSDLAPYLVKLEADLAYKTKEVPSYLTEYTHAIELINAVVPNTDSVEEAWSILLFSEFDTKNFAATKLGRARNFVFSEIITHQVPLSGGFRSFGLINYRGYFGGPFTSPNSYARGEA